MGRVVRIWSLAGAFGLLLTPHLVSAQEPGAKERQAAAEAYDKGSTAYLAEDWATAAQWFETAHRMAPASAALLQAIRAHERAQNFPRAATLAALLLRLYPNDGEAAEYAQGIVDEYGPQLLRVEVVCDDCELDLDGSLQEQKTFYVDADSTYTLTADFDTGKRTARVSGLPGDTQSIVLTAPTEETLPPVGAVGGVPEGDQKTNDDYTWGRDDRTTDSKPDADRPPFGPVVTWVGVGLTGALAIGSIVSTIDMMGGVDAYDTAANDANKACGQRAANCVQLYNDAQDLLTDGEAKETRTTILWSVTGAVAAGTLVIALFLTDWEGDDSSAHLDLGPDHATAFFRTKF